MFLFNKVISGDLPHDEDKLKLNKRNMIDQALNNLRHL